MRSLSHTFVLGAALAGAAVLYCFMFRIVTFYMGFVPGIKAFTAMAQAVSA